MWHHKDAHRPASAASSGASTGAIATQSCDFELAIELKFARASLDRKKLGEELLVNRQRYDQRKDVRHLLYLVFDHEGLLRNPRGLEKNLSKEASLDSFAVTVRIYDR